MKLDGMIDRLTIPGYELLTLIGQGSNGFVVKGRQVVTDRTVAIKFLKHELLNNEQEKQRLLGEARLLSRISHPNIIQVISAGLDSGSPYVITEFIEGITLADLIEKEGSLALDRFYNFFRQLCSGLKHAHENRIIHRDLKPRNIMVFDSPDGERLKILDFGIAKVNEETNCAQGATVGGCFIGSPTYMSPEQFINKVVDHRTDIYALGCIAHECLTGMPPFQGEQLLELMYRKQHEVPPSLLECATTQQIPSFLSKLVSDCLAHIPDQRPGSVEEIIIALDKHADTMSQVVPIAAQQRTVRARVAILLIGAAIIGIIVLLGSFAGKSNDSWNAIIPSTGNSTGDRGKRLQIHVSSEPIALLAEAQELLLGSLATRYERGQAVLTPEWRDRLAQSGNNIETVLSKIHANTGSLGFQAYLLKSRHFRTKYEFTKDPEDLASALLNARKAITFASKNGVVFRRPAESAFFTIGEIHRLRGEAEKAYDAYARALKISKTINATPEFEVDARIAGQEYDHEFLLKMRMSQCIFLQGQTKRAAEELQKALKEWLQEPECEMNLNATLGVVELASWYKLARQESKYHGLIDWAEQKLIAHESAPRSRMDAVGLRAILARPDIQFGNEENGIRLLRDALGKLNTCSANLNNDSYELIATSINLFKSIPSERQKIYATQIDELKDRLAEAKRLGKFPKWKRMFRETFKDVYVPKAGLSGCLIQSTRKSS